MFEGLKIDFECVVELGNSAGENDGPARRIFLDDNETVSAGELPDDGNVCGIGSELSGELLAAQMPIRPFSRRQLCHSVFQRVARAMPQHHGDFQPFRGIGLTDGSRSPHWLSLATDECTARHC